MVVEEVEMGVLGGMERGEGLAGGGVWGEGV